MGFVPVCWMQEEKSLELSLQLCEVKSFGVDMLLCFLWGPFFCQRAAFCLVHLLVSCSLLSYFTSLWFILSSSPLSSCIFATLSSQMFSFPLWFCYSFFFFFLNICAYTLCITTLCGKCVQSINSSSLPMHMQNVFFSPYQSCLYD